MYALHTSPRWNFKIPFLSLRLPANYLRGTHGDEQASIEDEHESHGGKSPLLVFINSGSGGHVGEQLAKYFKEALGRAQVLSEARTMSSKAENEVQEWFTCESGRTPF